MFNYSTEKFVAAASTHDFRGSLFTNRFAKNPIRVMQFHEWIESIRSGSYKELVSTYRRLQDLGEEKVAANVKTSMEAFLCQGVCTQGRKESDPMDSFSRIAFADYDFYDAAWTDAMVQQMREYKWVIGAHRSIGNGLRVYVLLPEFDREFYKIWLAPVMERLDAIVGKEHDKKCDHLKRLTLASYDENAWARPVEECTEPFAYTGAELADIHQKISRIQKWGLSNYPDEKLDLNQITISEIRNFSYEDLCLKVSDLMEVVPYAAHHHHDFLMICGAMARFEHCSSADLSTMAHIIRENYPTDGYDYKEILRNLLWGYAHPNVYKKAMESVKYAEYGSSPMSDDEREALIDEDEVINQECPYFGDEVYELLPKFITDLLLGVPDKRLKDIAAAGIITTMGSVMANMLCHYRFKVYSTNIAFCTIAKAGTGKGVAIDAMQLVKPIQKEYDDAYNKACREYQKKHRAYIAQQAKLEKGDAAGEWLEEPEVPQPVNFLNEGLTSLSRFIDDQAHSPHGMISFISELSELNDNEQANYGHLSATFRKVMMNEPISKNFRNGGKVTIPFPKHSQVMSGVKRDFVKYVRNVDSGNLSRLAILIGNFSIEWRDLDPKIHNKHNEREVNRRYEEAGQKVLEMFHYMQEHPTDVYFPEDKYDEINSFFSYSMMKLQHVNREELSSLVTRAAILCLRIGAILTGIRKFETKSTEREIDIHPDDLRAALSMTQVFLRHGAVLSTVLPKSDDDIRKLKPFDGPQMVYDRLPEQFTTADAEKLFGLYSPMGRTSVYQILKKWKEQGMVESTIRGKYTKLGGEPAATADASKG